VGIVGVGNNTSALVQGVYRYSQPEGINIATERQEGILFPKLCNYEIKDITFSVAFDVDSRKIGRDLGTAIYSEPNKYPRIFEEDLKTGTIVQPAPALDGVPEFLEDIVEVDQVSKPSSEELDSYFDFCVEKIHLSKTDVLVNFLPSGSHKATQFFARAAAKGHAAFINCIPSPVVNSPEILELFEKENLPLLGDDLESQFGSSLIHRTLLQTLETRGLEIMRSYQVNLGGNADFKNLQFRSDAKQQSKKKAISTISSTPDRINIVPSGGFLPVLGDNKIGYLMIEGRGWLGMPVNIDLKLSVQDSSNAAGVVIDLIRIAKGAIDQGLSGYVSLSYYFKNPLDRKLDTDEAIEVIRSFNSDTSA